MPFIRLIEFLSRSYWLLKEADAKMGLDMKEIYWGKYLRSTKEEEFLRRHFISTAAVIPVKGQQKVLGANQVVCNKPSHLRGLTSW